MGIVLSANQKTGHIPIPSRSGVQKGFVLISGHVSRPREILHSYRDQQPPHPRNAPLALACPFLETIKPGLHHGEMATELQRESKIKMGARAIKNHFKRNRLYNVGIFNHKLRL